MVNAFAKPVKTECLVVSYIKKFITSYNKYSYTILIPFLGAFTRHKVGNMNLGGVYNG